MLYHCLTRTFLKIIKLGELRKLGRKLEVGPGSQGAQPMRLVPAVRSVVSISIVSYLESGGPLDSLDIREKAYLSLEAPHSVI